jgi:hypothetical protein
MASRVLFVSPAQKNALINLCKASRCPFKSPEQLVFDLARLNIGYLELLACVGIASKAKQRWNVLQVVRCLHAFLVQSMAKVNLQLNEECRMNDGMEFVVEAMKITTLSVVEVISGSRLSTAVLVGYIEGSELFGLALAKRVMLARCENKEIGSIRPSVQASEIQRYGDDTFLVSSSSQIALLRHFAAHLVYGGTTRFVAVVCDTMSLEDCSKSRALRVAVQFAGSGLIRTIEWCTLDTKTGATVCRRETVPIGVLFGEFIGQSSIVDVLSNRAPAALYSCVRHSFCSSDGVPLFVDCNVHFGSLAREWKVLDSPLLAVLTRNVVAYPHVVVTVGHCETMPEWLKKIVKFPGLRYSPQFDLHDARL